MIAFRGGSGDWFDAGISGSGFQAFPGSKIDFQVEAMNGDVTQIISNPLPTMSGQVKKAAGVAQKL
ncbi:hypothetical protein [Candidatus Bathycorpusculum sp.]|uniref:hypothetical protein n=1 Tax=Candidatus Bathycorpusculum sp. TaxID=2994959 RepID=UPI0028231BEB|nr:hypothetical protein [Candidatus Termitimicrobium sp.]